MNSGRGSYRPYKPIHQGTALWSSGSTPLLPPAAWFAFLHEASRKLESKAAISVIEFPRGVEVTELLRAWRKGDQAALDRLTALVYAELHRMARHFMRSAARGNTLQTTALVNEVYLKLVDV